MLVKEKAFWNMLKIREGHGEQIFLQDRFFVCKRISSINYVVLMSYLVVKTYQKRYKETRIKFP